MEAQPNKRWTRERRPGASTPGVWAPDMGERFRRLATALMSWALISIGVGYSGLENPSTK